MDTTHNRKRTRDGGSAVDLSAPGLTSAGLAEELKRAGQRPGVLLGHRVVQKFPGPGGRGSALYLGTVVGYRTFDPAAGENALRLLGQARKQLPSRAQWDTWRLNTFESPGAYRVYFDDGDVADVDPDQAYLLCRAYHEHRSLLFRRKRVKRRAVLGTDQGSTVMGLPSGAEVSPEAGQRELRLRANPPLKRGSDRMALLDAERLGHWLAYREFDSPAAQDEQEVPRPVPLGNNHTADVGWMEKSDGKDHEAAKKNLPTGKAKKAGDSLLDPDRAAMPPPPVRKGPAAMDATAVPKKRRRPSPSFAAAPQSTNNAPQYDAAASKKGSASLTGSEGDDLPSLVSASVGSSSSPPVKARVPVNREPRVSPSSAAAAADATFGKLAAIASSEAAAAADADAAFGFFDAAASPSVPQVEGEGGSAVRAPSKDDAAASGRPASVSTPKTASPPDPTSPMFGLDDHSLQLNEVAVKQRLKRIQRVSSASPPPQTVQWCGGSAASFQEPRAAKADPAAEAAPSDAAKADRAKKGAKPDRVSSPPQYQKAIPKSSDRWTLPTSEEITPSHPDATDHALDEIERTELRIPTLQRILTIDHEEAGMESHKFVLSVSISSIPNAGRGLYLTYKGPDDVFKVPSYIDLGRYGPHQASDIKQDFVLEVKNFLYNDKPTEWTFDVPKRDGVVIFGKEVYSDMMFDITDDATGEVHEMAERTLLPFVNEVSLGPCGKKGRKAYARQLQTIDAIHHDDGSLHYLLRAGIRFSKNQTEELLVYYGEQYQGNRNRKSHDYCDLVKGDEDSKKVNSADSLLKDENVITTEDHECDMSTLSSPSDIHHMYNGDDRLVVAAGDKEHGSVCRAKRVVSGTIGTMRYYDLRTSLATYTENDIHILLDLFLHRPPVESAPRQRMHWLVDQLRIYLSELLYRNSVLPHQLQRKLSRALSSFPRRKGDPFHEQDKAALNQYQYQGCMFRKQNGRRGFQAFIVEEVLPSTGAIWGREPQQFLLTDMKGTTGEVATEEEILQGLVPTYFCLMY